METSDFLIVGGGTAGAVLAARLSRDPHTKVVLLEAGEDTPPNAMPPDVADIFPTAALNPGYFWPDLRAKAIAGQPARPYAQARLMGGGSSINGLLALRGLPSDYDGWAAAGAVGWAWEDVRGYFDRLVGDGLDRNRSLSYPTSRLPESEWPSVARALKRSAQDRGINFVPDPNETCGDGFFPMPASHDGKARTSSASAYLTNEVRRRPNLKIVPNAVVAELRLDGKRVVGAVAQQAGSNVVFRAREVVLCAGTLASPVIMMRSGIGPADMLSAAGITPIVDRPGVGRNLQNHVYLHFALTLPRRARMTENQRQFAVVGLRHSSSWPGAPAGDLLLHLFGRVSPRSFGVGVAMWGAALAAPASRGSVSLRADRSGPLVDIDFNLLSDPSDLPRLVVAAQLAESLLSDPAVAACYGDAYLLPSSPALHQFHRKGWRGSLLNFGAKLVLDAPAPIRRGLVARSVRPGRVHECRVGKTAISTEDVFGAAAPMGHPTGTCAIGRADDPLAVLNRNCQVYGIENLRVVDASVMPQITSANTNLSTLMIAERAADIIQQRP